MSLKTILNKQTDFTGEFPAEYAASGLWRFNESAPDEDTSLVDESGCGRNFYHYQLVWHYRKPLQKPKRSPVPIQYQQPDL